MKVQESYLEGDLSELIAMLGVENGLARQKARQALVELGSKAVPDLIAALNTENYYTRWEAIEALGEIGDLSAAQPLVDALLDEHIDIRGAAVKSLICLKRAALKPLLSKLVENFDQVWLREGASAVLYRLKQSKLLTDEELNVLEALEGAAPEEEAPWAAMAVLENSQ